MISRNIFLSVIVSAMFCSGILFCSPKLFAEDSRVMYEYEHLLRVHPNLNEIFVDAEKSIISRKRMEATIEGDRHLLALVVYEHRPGINMARQGEIFCNAALSKKIDNRVFSDLKEIVDGGTLVARYLTSKHTSNTYMREVESTNVQTRDGWNAQVCRVHYDSIKKYYPIPNSEQVALAKYSVAKEQYYQGNMQSSIKHFLSLQDNPNYLANALVYLSVILDKQDSVLAELFRNKFIDFDSVSDVDAIIEYLQWSQIKKHTTQLDAAIARCFQLREGCYDLSPDE